MNLREPWNTLVAIADRQTETRKQDLLNMVVRYALNRKFRPILMKSGRNSAYWTERVTKCLGEMNSVSAS
jgi:hypothetical protein